MCPICICCGVCIRLEIVAGSMTISEFEDNLHEVLEYDCSVQSWLEQKWLPHRHVSALISSHANLLCRIWSLSTGQWVHKISSYGLLWSVSLPVSHSLDILVLIMVIYFVLYAFYTSTGCIMSSDRIKCQT